MIKEIAQWVFPFAAVLLPVLGTWIVYRYGSSYRKPSTTSVKDLDNSENWATPESAASIRVIPYSEWETCLGLFKQGRMELEGFVGRFSGCIIEPKPKQVILPDGSAKPTMWDAPLVIGSTRYYEGAGSYVYGFATSVQTQLSGFDYMRLYCKGKQ